MRAHSDWVAGLCRPRLRSALVLQNKAFVFWLYFFPLRAAFNGCRAGRLVGWRQARRLIHTVHARARALTATRAMPMACYPRHSSSKHHAECMAKVRLHLIKLYAVLYNIGLRWQCAELTMVLYAVPTPSPPPCELRPWFK